MTLPEADSRYAHFGIEDARVAGTKTPVTPLVESASSSACDSPIIESAYGGDEHFEQRLAYHPQDVTFLPDSTAVPAKMHENVRTSDDIFGGVVSSTIDHRKFNALDLAAAAISGTVSGTSALGIDIAPDLCDEKTKTQAERQRELHKEMASVERRQSLQSAPLPLMMHSSGTASCPAANPSISGIAAHPQMAASGRRPSITFVNPFVDSEDMQASGARDAPRGANCSRTPPAVVQPHFVGPLSGALPGSPRRAVQAAAAEAASAAMHSLAQYTASATSEGCNMPLVPNVSFLATPPAQGSQGEVVPPRAASPGALRRFSVAVPSAKSAISAHQLYGAASFAPVHLPIVSPGPVRMPLQFVMEDPSSPASSKERVHHPHPMAPLYMRPPGQNMTMGSLGFSGVAGATSSTPSVPMHMSALHAAALRPMESIQADGNDEEEEERDTFATQSGSQACDEDDIESQMVMLPDGELMSVAECGARRHSLGTPHLYCCPWTGCGKIFNRFYNLRSHYRIHSGEKPFVCGSCDASFARNHDLKRHERIHSKDRPFVCEICSKSFSRNDALSRHLRLNSCNLPEQPVELGTTGIAMRRVSSTGIIPPPNL